MIKNKLLKIIVTIFVLVLIVTGCGKEKDNKVKYKLVVEVYDIIETVTTYDITVGENTIDVKYENEIKKPELADGPLPQPKGEFTINDKYFIEPLKKVLKTWEKENGKDYSIDDAASLLIGSLEVSQNRKENLCKINGNWYCDMNEDSMDYNNDGKITVEENFAYYVHEIDSSITLVDE